MHQRIGPTTLVVNDYDDAISFYTEKLGFEIREDVPLGGDKRWVLIEPAKPGHQ